MTEISLNGQVLRFTLALHDKRIHALDCPTLPDDTPRVTAGEAREYVAEGRYSLCGGCNPDV